MLPEKFNRQADQVIKIHCLIGGKGGGIVPVNPGNIGILFTGCGFYRHVRCHHGVFPEGDACLDIADDFTVSRLGQVLDQGKAVIAVQDGKTGLHTKGGIFLPQDLHAQGMECRDGQLGGIIGVGKHPADAFPHFCGGFVGECQGGDMLCLIFPGPDHMDDFLGDDPGFAGACACQYQAGAIQVSDCLPLLGIQSIENR